MSMHCIVKCNVCGKAMSSEDYFLENIPSFYGIVGYGSKYDGEDLQIDFCPECFDSFVDDMNKKCKISPIVSEVMECDFEDEDGFTYSEVLV